MKKTSKRQSVAMITSYPPVVGISDYALSLVRELASTHTVNIFSYKEIYPKFLYPGQKIEMDVETPNIPNVNVHFTQKWYSPISILRTVLSIKDKVVHIQHWSPPLVVLNTFLVLLLRILKPDTKIIVTVHNIKFHTPDYFSPLHFTLEKLSFVFMKLCDHFIVHTEKLRENFSKIYGVDIDKVTAIPLGIGEAVTVSNGDNRKKFRKKLKIKEEETLLLYLGNIRAYKGVDTLIRAYKIVQDRNPNIRLIIAGRAWAGWEYYEKIINELDLQEKILCHIRYIKQKEFDLYHIASDVIVLPYRNFESQTAAGAKAINYGIPVIVSDKGGLPELVLDENCIFETENIDDLAKKILKLVSDKNLYEKAKNDALIVRDKYSWDKIAEQTATVYKKLLSK